jgi:hypothetical protein
MPTLNEPQARFLALPHKYRAYVAGFGAGKTWSGAAAHCRHALEWPRVNAGYFAPTFPLIRDIFYPTIEEVAHDWGLRARVHESNKEVHLFGGKQYRSTIICRSLEKPADIVGFKIGHAQVDELDLLKPDKAAVAWRKIIGRMRYKRDGLRNGIDITTTPEGFRFVWQTFVRDVRARPALANLYGMVQASTYDNEANLPDDYIDSLRASYPRQLIRAYLRGLFVNLASGSVYADFDRDLNGCDTLPQEGETLHVGMDFNVLKMAAVVFVDRNNDPHAVGELANVRDTPTMARLLRERYIVGKAAPHTVIVYPDASGQNTSSKNASESDLSILRQAGFSVKVNSHNPAVKDRVNAVNALILNDKGQRRLKVNTQACPHFTDALEQQAYDEHGDPDKSTGHDHHNDAGGYRLVYSWPIKKPTAVVASLRA